MDGVESLDSLSFFRFCPPIILWVCSFVLNQFKNLFAFLSRSDLCYYTALLYFLAETSELISAILLLLLTMCYSCYYSSSSTWDFVSFLLLFFLGCRLFACHDYYSYLLHPAERRGRGNGVSRLIQYCGHGTRMESKGVVHLRVLV